MKRAAAHLAAVGAALSVFVPAASAAIKVTAVDASSYPTIRVSAVTSHRTTIRPIVLENGRRMPLSSAQNLGRAKAVVVAIDRSQSMRGRAFADAIAAARTFVNAKSPGDRLSVVAFGSSAIQLTRFSSTRTEPDSALRTAETDEKQGTALYDAVVKASRSFRTETLPGRVIVVMTDGRDVSSEATLADAIGAARQAGASVFAIAIESKQFSPTPLRELAAKTGGSYRGTTSSAALRQAYAGIAAELRRTWRLEYATAARPGENALLTVHSLGSMARAKLELAGAHAATGDKPSRLLPDIFYSPLGTQMIALISGLIVLLGASLALTTVKGARLRKRLAPHVATGVDTRKRKAERQRLAIAAGLFRATEGTFGHWRFWKRLDRLVERSDLPLRTVELAYLMVGFGLVGGFLGAAFGLAGLLMVAALAVSAFIPLSFVWFKAVRRTRAFENQLPDVLITLAAALKAGHSFKAGLQTIVDEGNPPASKEFKRVLTEAQLGRPLNDGLMDMSERLGSKNFDFVITAVTIQQQVGGSLAGLIDMVADTVRQRQQFVRKIKGLTAMGRAGAYVLVGLPFFVGAIITIINPTYMDPLFHSSTGHKLIYTGLGMMVFGSAVLKKIVSFKG